MDTTLPPSGPVPAPPKARSGFRIFLIILGVFLLGCGLATAGAVWWFNHNFNPGRLKPVSLSTTEQVAFDAKIKALQTTAPTDTAPRATVAPAAPAAPERTLTLSAREINAYLAAQQLGDSVKVELGPDSVAATMIVPTPPDAPFFSGRSVRVRVAMAVRMSPEKKLAIEMSDLSVGGISLPNDWLGGLKGVNLVDQKLENDPGLQRLLAGIQAFEITAEGVRVVLNE